MASRQKQTATDTTNAAADDTDDAATSAIVPVASGNKHDRHYFPIADNLADIHRANVYSENARQLNALDNLTDVDDSKGFASAIGNTDYIMAEEDIKRINEEKGEIANLFRYQDGTFKRQHFASYDGATSKSQKIRRLIDMFERQEGGARDHFDVANETLICSRCKTQFMRERCSTMHEHIPGCNQGRSLIEERIYQYENSPEGEVGRYIPYGKDKSQCTKCDKIFTAASTKPSGLMQKGLEKEATRACSCDDYTACCCVGGSAHGISWTNILVGLCRKEENKLKSDDVWQLIENESEIRDQRERHCTCWEATTFQPQT
eukprot:scaffold49227_cov33-Cyclotella_meneghiniana.AAC.1